MPSLLFLSQRIPYPPTKGEKIRAFRIFDYLRRSYDIYLGSLVDDPADFEHLATLRAMCADAHIAPLNRRLAKIACLRGLLTGEALSVTFYRDRRLAAWVRRVLREVNPEVIFVYSSNAAPYMLDLRGRERVCITDLVDVDSEKWRAYAATAPLPMRWLHRREWRRVAALEARIARECDWSTFVSADEAALFTRLQPAYADKIRAISNGVDHAYFDPAQHFDPPFAADRPNFVFTGTMDYPPNIDAVTWFARAILPLIRRRAPDACFHVVGANPTAEVRALAALDGVLVTGRVPDVRPYLAHASAAVAPLRIARGIQNKVLEAMAMARPVVVTPDALEGIEAVPGIEVLLADTPDAFAAACLAAAGDAGAAIGAAARRRVKRDYVWAERLRGFDPLLTPPGQLAETAVPAS
jgi:sugar transferase (PEP-CTERM/EpsH1 system associated)